MRENSKFPIWYIIAGIFILVWFKDCTEGEQVVKEVVKTEVKIKTVYDTITNTIIEDRKVPVYIIKKKDTIIYKDKPSDSTITANEYTSTLSTGEASANIKVVTSGELLDISGVITYPEKETSREVIKTVNASGMFIGANFGLMGEASYGVNLDYQIKNKIIVGGFINYQPINGGVNGGIKIGIKF